MPALQVKDCPTEVYERLRACAARENRSISQQALTILEDYLGMRPAPARNDRRRRQTSIYEESCRRPDPSEGLIEKRRQLFERINSRPPLLESDSLPSSVELVRQSREEDAA